MLYLGLEVKGLEGVLDLILDITGQDFTSFIIEPTVFLDIVDTTDPAVSLRSVTVNADGHDAVFQNGEVLVFLLDEDFLLSCHSALSPPK